MVRERVGRPFMTDRVLNEVVHKQFQVCRVGLLESEVVPQVSRHLIQDLLAPVDLDGTLSAAYRK